MKKIRSQNYWSLCVCALGLFLTLGASSVRADEPVVVGAACSNFGASTMTTDRKDIAVCLEDDSGNPVWKSLTLAPSGVPVGAIIAWPATIDPADMAKWLECNGQAITKTAYPELYAVVGSTVPDFRGMFLRGLGSKSVSQINGTTNGTTATFHASAQLGETQGDAQRNLTGTYFTYVGSPTGVYTTKNGWGWWLGAVAGTTWEGTTQVFDAARTVPVANEIRPVNMAVRYLIRAKN